MRFRQMRLRRMRLWRTTWLGAGAVALVVPAMLISRRFARLLFEHHDDALFVLQWVPGVGARKRGRFEQADGGTLLLDEVTELPLELQPKLLHVLQDGEFFRIGGAQPIRCDVRVIAATNRDLESAMEAGEFRQDLYYRLNVVEIRVPPLRERLEHIPGLVEYFQRRFVTEYGHAVAVSAATLELFRGYDWPGNVRELENMMRRIAVLGSDDHVADELRARVTGRVIVDGSAAVRSTDAEVRGLKEISRAAAREAERAVLLAALERSGWNRLHAAQLLGISYRSLLYKLADHRLRPPAREAGEGSVA